MTQYIDDDYEFPNAPKTLLPILRFMFTPLVDPTKQNKSLISNPFSFLFSKKKINKKEYISFAGLGDVPIEFLALICRDLDITDLFSLAGVCKHLRTLLLDVENLQVQDLWKTSRLEHSPFLDIQLPKGMNEQEFCSLTSLERGCEFCHQRKSWVRIYWKYRVRSCHDCYMTRFVSNSYSKRSYYKTNDSLEELKQLEINDKKRLEYIISYRKQRLSEILEELSEVAVEDNESVKSGFSNQTSNTISLRYDPSILRKCPCYHKEWLCMDQPFTLRDEVKLRRKFDYEYQILSKHYTS